MSVRAKFRVDKIEHTVNGASITLAPVTSGSKENEQFYKWTPCGSILLSTINKDAAAQFNPGDEFYVDFTKASESSS